MLINERGFIGRAQELVPEGDVGCLPVCSFVGLGTVAIHSHWLRVNLGEVTISNALNAERFADPLRGSADQCEGLTLPLFARSDHSIREALGSTNPDRASAAKVALAQDLVMHGSRPAV